MKRTVLTVSQISRYLKNLIDDDMLLNDVYVRGEVSNFKAHASGLYFTLKDEKTETPLQCVMFRQDADEINFTPENGMVLIAYGRIAVYEKNGIYELIAETLEPFGKGALSVAFEQLKNKLAAEGLFDKSRKRRIFKANTVAVITSDTGAVVSDIITVARRRNPLVKIYILPASVQGGNAPVEIVNALSFANKLHKSGEYTFDAVILGRGGGTSEDLNAFNQESVARAVFASEIPVVSAVGHETDFTICDFTADMRAETPSAAAEMLVEDINEIYENIRNKLSSFTTRLEKKLFAEKKRLDTYAARLTELISTEKDIEKLSHAKKHLDRTIDIILLKHEKDLSLKTEILSKVSPLEIMKRGFSYTLQNGQVVTSVLNVNMNENITIKLSDGEITAKPEMRHIQNGGKKDRQISEKICGNDTPT